MAKRVLIIGGYGNFGGTIARGLAGEAGIQLVIGGRSRGKAQEFTHGLGARNAAEGAALDISGDVAARLAELRPDTVIHTTGPFQGQSYAVAEACIGQGCHYIDLADARDFVAGIVRYDAQAKAKNVLVTSGASSVPCLTAAVIDRYRPEFRTLEKIEYGINAAQQTNRGLATVAAILTYVGKPFSTLIDGRMQRIYGWQDLHAETYPELGPRLFGNCDIADLGIFPRRYPELKTIRFSAGIEMRGLHLGVWLLSWPVRWKIIPSLAGLAPLLWKSSFLFDAFGTGRSGFHMYLTGTGKDGRSKTARFYIIARQGHGPRIPCVPAILLAKGLVNGRVSATGAKPCLDLISLDMYREGFAGMDVSVVEQ